MKGEALHNGDATETPIQVPNVPARRPTNAKSGASKHKTCRVGKHRRNRSTKASEASESFVLDGEEHEIYAATRNDRLQYYKRLDDYELRKENVYII